MATTPHRRKANTTFTYRFLAGVLLYLGALALATAADSLGFAPWIPALLAIPAAGLMAWSNVGMYRSGDEFERRKIAEAILFAFAVATPLILAVGVLQFYLLPELNWIFAFSILMASWLLGTLISAIRYR